MADPASLAMLGSTALSMGTSAYGAIEGAKGAAASATSQAMSGLFAAGIANLNAKIALQNADYASVTGEQEAARYGMGAAQRQGNLITQQSASGLDVNTGSNKATAISNQIISNMDIAQIRANAAKTAYDYKVQAGADAMQAQGDIMGAQNVEAAGGINAMTSIVSGASSVASQWAQANQFFGAPGTNKTPDYGPPQPTAWDQVGNFITQLGGN